MFFEFYQFLITKLPTPLHKIEILEKQGKKIIKSGTVPEGIYQKDISEYPYKNYQEITTLNPDGAVAMLRWPHLVQDYDDKEQGLKMMKLYQSQGRHFNYYETDHGVHIHGKYFKEFPIKDGLPTLFLMTVDIKCQNKDNTWKKGIISCRKHSQWLKPLAPEYQESELDEFPDWGMPFLDGKITGLIPEDFKKGQRNESFLKLNQKLYQKFNGKLSFDERYAIATIYRTLYCDEKFSNEEIKSCMRDWKDFKPQEINESHEFFNLITGEFLFWKLSAYLIKKFNIKLYGHYFWKLTENGYFRNDDNDWIKKEAKKMIYVSSPYDREKVEKDVRDSLIDLHQNGKKDNFTLINFLNGVFNTKTFGFSETRTDEFTPYSLGINYDKNFDKNHPIESAYFEKVINDVFKDNLEWAEMLYEWVGYHFQLNHPAKALLQVYGRTGAGKSLIFEHFVLPLFEPNLSKLDLKQLNDPNSYNHSLFNALSNYCGDESEKFLGNSGFYKRWTGNDASRIRQIYEKPIFVYLPAKLTIVSNHIIGFDTNDEALDVRIHLLKFNQNLNEIPEYVNRSVWEKLDEYGILCAEWMLFKAIPALKRLKANKWIFPIVSQEAIDDYKDTYNDLKQWFKDGNLSQETGLITPYTKEFFLDKTASDVALLVKRYKENNDNIFTTTKSEDRRAGEFIDHKFNLEHNKPVSVLVNEKPLFGQSKYKSKKLFQEKN